MFADHLRPSLMIMVSYRFQALQMLHYLENIFQLVLFLNSSLRIGNDAYKFHDHVILDNHVIPQGHVHAQEHHFVTVFEDGILNCTLMLLRTCRYVGSQV